MGTLSQDGRTLLTFSFTMAGTEWFRWINLPRSDARSTATTTLYTASGPAAQGNIVFQKRVGGGCSATHTDGVDYSQPVTLEVWLKR